MNSAEPYKEKTKRHISLRPLRLCCESIIKWFVCEQRLARKYEEKAAALIQGALNLNRAV
jgi:hypothetical protein